MRNERGSTIIMALVYMILSTMAVSVLAAEAGFSRQNTIYTEKGLSVANLAEAGMAAGLVQASLDSGGNGYSQHTYTYTLPQGTAQVIIGPCTVAGHPVPPNSPCNKNPSGLAQMQVSSQAILTLPGPAMYTKMVLYRNYQTCKGQSLKTCDVQQTDFVTAQWSNPPVMPWPWRIE